MPINPRSQEHRDTVAKLRTEAQVRGDLTYENPMPCPQGHFIRYAASGHCQACQQKEARARYRRKMEARRDRLQH